MEEGNISFKKSVAQIQRDGEDKMRVSLVSFDENAVDATQYLHGLANSGNERLNESAFQIKNDQQLITEKVASLNKKVDILIKDSTLLNDEIRRLEKEANYLPNLKKWISLSVSQITSMFKQAEYLEQVVDCMQKGR